MFLSVLLQPTQAATNSTVPTNHRDALLPRMDEPPEEANERNRKTYTFSVRP